MKKRIIATVLLVVLCLSLFACGKKSTTITTAEAQKIALEEIGKTEAEVDDIHVHATQYDGKPCYQMHITADDDTYYVYIDQTGKVLATQK